MIFLGMYLNMSTVASLGSCIEVVGKEGQGDAKFNSANNHTFRLLVLPKKLESNSGQQHSSSVYLYL